MREGLDSLKDVRALLWGALFHQRSDFLVEELLTLNNLSAKGLQPCHSVLHRAYRRTSETQQATPDEEAAFFRS
jgi:hypothetical protein